LYSIRQFLDKKGREVFSVQSDTPVIEALELMADKNCGALVVLDDQQRLVGLISERDYARKVDLLKKASHDTPVAEIMTREVVSVTEEQTLDGCLSIMAKHNIRHLPVVYEKQVVGVLGIGELVKLKMAEKENEIQNLTRYISGNLTYR
jgi:CBS domain-containing protein